MSFTLRTLIVLAAVVVVRLDMYAATMSDSHDGVEWVISGCEEWGKIEKVRIGQENIPGVSDVRIPGTIGNWKIREIASRAFSRQTKLTSVYIPETVRKVGDEAFRSCVSLTNVIFSSRQNGREGVQIIGCRAFMNCTALSGVQLPDSLSSIAGEAFGGCCNLREITLPGELMLLDGGAFDRCTILERIYLPFMVNLRLNPFTRCPGLKIIEVDPLNENLRVKDGILFCNDGSGIYSYPAARKGDVLKIPSGVEWIAPFAFSDTVNLKEIILPNSLRELGNGAFARSGVRSLVIPDRVERLGDGAFMHSQVTNIVLGVALKDIGRICFLGCARLQEIRFRGGAPKVMDDFAAPSNCVIRVDRVHGEDAGGRRSHVIKE